MTVKFGSVEASPGTLGTGYVELGHYPDGPIMAPVMLACGRQPGPRLYVQCLVHGPEVVGPLATARFLRGLDLERFRGRISALLVANPLGFRQYSRLTPQDGANLNRIFPGKSDGLVSEQLAHRLLELADAQGDVMLDLHSGGDLTITAFYVIHHKADTPASLESSRLAASTGSRYQWASDEDWMRGSAITNFTTRYQKPALIVECGGGARVTEDDLENFAGALKGLCQALGMLPGEPAVAQNIRRGGNAVHIKATRGGFWHPEIAPGDDMVAGQLMGRMVDAFGEVVETLRCPLSKAWVGSIRRPFMPIYSGDQVVEVVESMPE